MPRGRPFLFCRYAIHIGDEQLAGRHQFTVLSELQGRPAPHGQKAADEGRLDSIIMRPRQIRAEGREAITWSVGHILDSRVIAKYDKKADRIDLEHINEESVRYSDFVAVPALGVLAVDDRGSEMHLGGKQAINRFKSVLRSAEDADATILSDVTPDEVRKALKDWNLTRFKFTVQPNNPRPVSRLGQELSDWFKNDGIGKVVGTAHPAQPKRMRMANDGFIGAVNALTEAGYGQVAVSGTTPDGLEAEIKKPRFETDVLRNEAIQAKPRELRVYVESEDLSDEEILSLAAVSLIRFHDNE